MFEIPTVRSDNHAFPQDTLFFIRYRFLYIDHCDGTQQTD